MTRVKSAMVTNFGRPVLDDVKVDKAIERYEIFHKKDPRKIVELDDDHRIPVQVEKVGELLSIAYLTDKWKEDGDDEAYKHVIEEGGQTLYEPRGSHSWAEKCNFPIKPPREVTMLGRCLGFYVKRADDGQVYEANPGGCYLFCSPSGNALYVYSPRDGFIALACGGNLNVEKDGIEG